LYIRRDGGDALPFGQPYTKTQVIEAYKKVYEDRPEWLKAALDYITK